MNYRKLTRRLRQLGASLCARLPVPTKCGGRHFDGRGAGHSPSRTCGQTGSGFNNGGWTDWHQRQAGNRGIADARGRRRHRDTRPAHVYGDCRRGLYGEASRRTGSNRQELDRQANVARIVSAAVGRVYGSFSPGGSPTSSRKLPRRPSWFMAITIHSFHTRTANTLPSTSEARGSSRSQALDIFR